MSDKLLEISISMMFGMDEKVKGEYADAEIFTSFGKSVDDIIDNHARAQVQLLCDTEACAGSKIRMMPDVHAGKVGPIGLTMTLGPKIMPALIGNDIGCGISQTRFAKNMPLDFPKLDKEIRANIPSGSAVHKMPLPQAKDVGSELLGGLHCAAHIQKDRALRGLGTLGGGNHFIELGLSDELDMIALTVHSGSRNLGQQVYEWYMKAGQKELKARGIEMPYEMTWLEGELMNQYLDDVHTVCAYAKLNRELMIRAIVKTMKWKKYLASKDMSIIDCPHNFVGEDGVLRKGAISAHEGESLFIPINMRDGILMATGKGNPDWNCSAPHGSGRILKRSEVANHHTVSEFKQEMKGIWSSCIAASTLDESPFAYRGLREIEGAISETADFKLDDCMIKPIYSFKACGEGR